MPTRNSTAARKYRDPDIVVADESRLVACLGFRSGCVVERIGLRLGRQLVLRHVGRGWRGIRIVLRVGCQPGVKGDPELGPEPAHRDCLILRAVQSECDEPGVEGRGIEIALREGSEVVPGGQCASVEDLQSRRAMPFPSVQLNNPPRQP
jgi:hypothetical protein